MFRKILALSEKGASDAKKGIAASAVANISLMVPVGLLLMLLTELLKPVLGEDRSDLNIWLYTGLAAGVLAIIFITHWVQYRSTYVSAYEESANRRITLAEKLRRLPLSFFGQRDLSELTTTMMGDCTELEHTFSHAVPQMFGAIISITLVCIGLFAFEWHMALAVFLALPISLALIFGSKKLQDKFGTQKIKSKLISSDGVQECLENIKDIKSSNREEEYLVKLDRKLDDVIRASIRSELVTGSFISSASIVLRLGFASTVLIGATLLGRGEINFFTYLVFLLTASRIYDPLMTVFMQIAELFNARIQIRRAQEIENQLVQQGASSCEPKGYDISFDHVTFSYNEEIVLNDVSFTAKQGEVTALVGPSGSGKSTAAKLAARFWDPNSGTVSIGGVDVTTVEPETLLKNYAIVFQDVVLFGGSIMENIRLGKRDATDEEVYAAAKAAQCDVFISRFPDGYQTLIGENGATLSGGERQRISIARALLKDAPVILLDEATASLDVENETLIQSALSTLIRNKTVLVIAHRMRTVAGAHKIVVLQDGKVAEQGNHRELLNKNGLYARLFALQKQAGAWKL
jgi:ATP-binding cassette subfamily B protein IrtB